MATPPNPLFGDRVPAGTLPAELEGKTPLEIAQYYQERETRILRTQAQPPVNTPAPPPPPPTREDWEADPQAAAQRVFQNSVTRQEFQNVVQSAQGTLLQAAKLAARQGKKYWERLLPEMERIAQNDQQNATNSEWWVTTYNYLVGRDLSTLLAEDAAAAAAAQRSSSEPPAGPSEQPPAPRELKPVDLKIMNGLGLSEEQYRKGEKNYEIGKFPVTLDNRTWRSA